MRPLPPSTNIYNFIMPKEKKAISQCFLMYRHQITSLKIICIPNIYPQVSIKGIYKNPILKRKKKNKKEEKQYLWSASEGDRCNGIGVLDSGNKEYLFESTRKKSGSPWVLISVYSHNSDWGRRGGWRHLSKSIFTLLPLMIQHACKTNCLNCKWLLWVMISDEILKCPILLLFFCFIFHSYFMVVINYFKNQKSKFYFLILL